MDINDLGGPMRLSGRFSRNLSEFLTRGPDFGQADRSFGSMVSNPQMFVGPGGSALDPSQSMAQAGTSYLGRRQGISDATQQQRGSFADLLLSAGNNMGAIAALQKQLEAAQYGGQSSVLGGLGI